MTISRFVTEDGTSLAFEDAGSGPPMIWQHGLGGDRQQAAEVFPGNLNVRRITLECRGHGESALGPPASLSIAQFAGDIIGLLDHLGIKQTMLGGISMGAAISMRLAATMPSRVKALVLARPAWLDEAAPFTMRPFLLVAELLSTFGPEEGLRKFEQTDELAAVEQMSPDNAASLRGLFSRTTNGTVELLSRIASDGAGVSKNEIATIAVPTLVIGNAEDYIHPLAYANSLQAWIPGASLQIIPSKSVDKLLYTSHFRAALGTFLQTAKAAR